MTFVGSIREQAERLEREVRVLYLAARHPGTPWYARAIAWAVAAYILSPIDLVPDFIPLLGYVDDVLVVLLGARLAWRLIPEDVIAECRLQAARTPGRFAAQEGAGERKDDPAP